MAEGYGEPSQMLRTTRANHSTVSQAPCLSPNLYIAHSVKRTILNNLYVGSKHQTPCDLHA